VKTYAFFACVHSSAGASIAATLVTLIGLALVLAGLLWYCVRYWHGKPVPSSGNVLASTIWAGLMTGTCAGVAYELASNGDLGTVCYPSNIGLAVLCITVLTVGACLVAARHAREI
jgi:vacuolar-type H+-ATPase subunit I/STV1